MKKLRVSLHKLLSHLKLRSRVRSWLGIPRRTYRYLRKHYKRIFVVLALTTALVVLGVVIFVQTLQRDLPDPHKLVEREGGSIIILDRDGAELYRFYDNENREFVSLYDLNPQVKWAIIASEDEDFYNHAGIDPLSMARCLFYYAQGSETICGGSTLTQQLVKNTLLREVYGEGVYARNWERKIKEIILAMQVEKEFSKDEIMQMYINEVPTGSLNYGFQSAARAYYDKDLNELSLAEVTMLVGLLPSPTNYNPIFGQNPDAAYERQQYVLDQLSDMGEAVTGISQAELTAARSEELTFTSSGLTQISAPHFVFFVEQELRELLPEETLLQGGLIVNTSLDSDMQKLAEEHVRKSVETANTKYQIHNGALLAVDPKAREVLAMVGSIDFFNDEEIKVSGSINMTTAMRPKASLVKPFSYLAAFEQGWGPYTVAPDSKFMDLGYPVTNYDGGYSGVVNLRYAMTQSLNLPSLYVYQFIGDNGYLSKLNDLGITLTSEQQDDGIVLGLGTGDMTLFDTVQAYTVFANAGEFENISAIISVEDVQGKALYGPKKTRYSAADPAAVEMLNWTLCDLGDFQDHFGQEYYTVGGQKVCGKTGTSDTSTDLMAILYHKNLVVGTWMGNSDGSSPFGTVSARTALPMAHGFLELAQAEYPVEMFALTDAVAPVDVCKDTGLLPGQFGCERERSVRANYMTISEDLRAPFIVCKATG